MKIQLPSQVEVARALAIWGAADTRLSDLVARYGHEGTALRRYGLLLWEDGQVQAACQALVGAAALHPTDPKIWTDLAGAFGAVSLSGEAKACLAEALERGDTRAQTWLRLATIQSATGEPEAAADSFGQAIARDDQLGEAWFGLGLLHYDAYRYGAAIPPLRRALELGHDDDANAHACLGQALYMTGDFAGAAKVLAIASDLESDNQTFALRRVRSQFVADLITGPIEPALAACGAPRFSQLEFEKTLYESFHLLSAFGYRDAAIRVGTYRLARAPDDAIQAYLLAVLTGETPERAPDNYVVSSFDQFAEQFDQKLVGVLGYKVPAQLAALIERHRGDMTRILDLGCGTGLVGSHLARAGRRIMGIDLSPRMLDQARARGCYDCLVEAEVLDALADHPERYGADHTAPELYDVVVAADVLIYFGNLEAFVRGVGHVLAPGGIWAVSVETTEAEDFVLLPSGRFAHRTTYITEMANRAGFRVIELVPTQIRLEANHPAMGVLILMARM